MNANELADELERLYQQDIIDGVADLSMPESATMLRQQQAEIEALKLGDIQWSHAFDLAKIEIADLKAEIETLKANRKHDFGLGEASGFIKGHKENPYKAITNTKIEPTVVSYTHPVKELTDEEIFNLEQQAYNLSMQVQNQKAEIEALKAGKIRAYDNGVEDGRKPNTNPVKELTREDRLKLIGTLKWAEDLLREAGHDEAVDEVQDCLMILRKAQENV